MFTDEETILQAIETSDEINEFFAERKTEKLAAIVSSAIAISMIPQSMPKIKETI
jgi:hypothetical protein